MNIHWQTLVNGGGWQTDIGCEAVPVCVGALTNWKVQCGHIHKTLRLTRCRGFAAVVCSQRDSAASFCMHAGYTEVTSHRMSRVVDFSCTDG